MTTTMGWLSSHNRAGRKGSVPGLDDQGQEDEADWDGEDDDENEDEDDPAVGYLEVGPDDEDEDEAFEVHVPPTATAEATAQGQLSMEAIDPNGVLGIVSGTLPSSIAVSLLCHRVGNAIVPFP